MTVATVGVRRGPRPCAAGPEAGSGSVLAVALAGLLVAVTVSALWLASAMVCAHRARAAADLAALAGAVAAAQDGAGRAGPAGRWTGDAACRAARRTAAANGAALTTCVVSAGGTVLVSVAVDLMVPIPGAPGHAAAAARAGPAGGAEP